MPCEDGAKELDDSTPDDSNPPATELSLGSGMADPTAGGTTVCGRLEAGGTVGARDAVEDAGGAEDTGGAEDAGTETAGFTATAASSGSELGACSEWTDCSCAWEGSSGGFPVVANAVVYGIEHTITIANSDAKSPFFFFMRDSSDSIFAKWILNTKYPIFIQISIANKGLKCNCSIYL